MTARSTTVPAEDTVTKPDFAAMRAAFRPAERTVPVCMRGDLAADHEAADRQLEKLLKTPAPKFSGDGRGELRQRIEALEAEMAASTYPFRLRALPGPKFRALTAEHVPRRAADGEPDPRDEIGVNVDTLFDALIPMCLIDPVLDAAAWRELADQLTDRQYHDIADAAWLLNRGRIDVPFSRAVSRLTQNSEPG